MSRKNEPSSNVSIKVNDISYRLNIMSALFKKVS